MDTLSSVIFHHISHQHMPTEEDEARPKAIEEVIIMQSSQTVTKNFTRKLIDGSYSDFQS